MKKLMYTYLVVKNRDDARFLDEQTHNEHVYKFAEANSSILRVPVDQFECFLFLLAQNFTLSSYFNAKTCVFHAYGPYDA